MANPLKNLVLSFLAVFAVISSASVVQPNDGPYSRVRRGQILYIYDDSARENIPQVAGYMEAIRELYDQSFNWKLDEEQDLILASPAQQVANAYATVNPNITSLWYPSGGGFLEESAESSWFLTLATHETAHLYQLNTKGPFNSFAKSIFGNAVMVFPFFPIFIHPNMLLPTFMIEGNAVFNESRANMGGRLHSGEYRALVLSEIKAGEVTPTRLINNEFRFPFGQFPYAQGGYFQAHLAAKHGVDKTNEFFLKHGYTWFWPFVLNHTFRKHFGSSYPQEIHEYVREMQGLADKQKVSDGRVYAEGLYFGQLNHDNKYIYLLAEDGIKPGTLYKVSKSGSGSTAETVDIPRGKVFFVDGEPKSVSSEQNDLHHITYSLYGEGHAMDERYVGQIVSDQRAGKTVALDASHSWLENHVLVNGEVYDVAHSQPILDDQGNVYYFRQNGTERVLYMNRQPIFKYDGFYGKLMEVGADGGIYFIANTDYGSTLYEYKDKEISRVLSSDVVTDARLIDQNKILAVEVGPNGHRAVVVNAERKPATPATYSYGFQSYNLKPAKIGDDAQFKADERAYNSFGQQRYSSLDFNSGWDSANGFNGTAIAHFIDPMQYQAFDLGFSGSAYGSQDFLVGYSFTKFLPTFYVQYAYEKELWHQRNDAARFAHRQQVFGGWMLPLLRWHRWDAQWSLLADYNKDDNHFDPSSSTTTTKRSRMEETYGAINSLTLQFAQEGDPAIGMYPWHSWTLNYRNRLESEPGAWRKKYNTFLVQTHYTHGFPLQFYATGSGYVAWAENHDINVAPDSQQFVQDIHIPRLSYYKSFTAKTAAAARLEVAKVFNVPAYSPRIPFSIERIAPLVLAQGMTFDTDGRDHGDYPASIGEVGVGADIQVLLFHLAHAKLRFVNAWSSDMPAKSDSNKQVLLSTKYSF